MASGVFLALSFKNKTLGAAFYDESEAYVYYMPDIFEDDSYSQLRMLIEDVRPTNVIASCAQDAGFLKALRTICNFNAPNATKYDESVDDAGGEDEPEAPHYDVATGFDLTQQSNNRSADAGSNVPVYDGAAVAAKFNAGQEANDKSDDGNMIVSTTAREPEESEPPEEEFFAMLQLMPAVAFSEDECKTRVTEVFHGFGDGQASMAAGFRIDFSSVNAIRAFGALLRFLSQQRIGVEFDDITEKTPIKGIRAFHLENVMLVDATTLKALQVFESEYNPQAIKQKKTIFGRQFREGVSIFNLCNVCKSVPGKQMLKRWFRRPTTDRALLIDRHSAISYFYQDCNLEVARTIRNYLRNVSNVGGTLRRIRTGTASISDWMQVYKTASALSSIFDYVRNMNLKMTATKDCKLYLDDIMRIGALISEIMDIEGSRAEGRFVVRDGIDDELDVLKLKYLSLPESLTIIAQAEAESYDVDSCSVGYLPIIGYLLVLPEDIELSPDAEANLELVFSADGESHYKSPRMRELDNEIGDIKMMIVDFEKTIVINLQTLVLKRANSLVKGVEIAAHLDCLLSLAAVAREYDWHRPKLVDDAVIDVTNGRHPLAEMISSLGFVPNPIKSGGTYSKVKLISGPNASGKSVYLKMIGIICYMASIGSFVPAESAIIGPINRIISRMYTIDSVLDGMSSFANDLRQMSEAVCSSDEHSLVIMDEFGKGTMTEVGLSLLASCMNYWLAKGRESCPHVFASSHFHVLPTLLINSDFLTCHTMDIKYTSNTEIDFFYKLIDGSIDNSYASYAARKNGISEEIMERADAVYEHLNSGHLIIDVPKSLDDTIEAENYILAERMDSIMKEFDEFDLAGDPMGFMKLAISVLDPDDGHDDSPDVTSNELNKATPTRRIHSQEEIGANGSYDILGQFAGFASEPQIKRRRFDVTPFAFPLSAPSIDSSENSVQDTGADNSVAMENVNTESAEVDDANNNAADGLKDAASDDTVATEKDEIEPLCEQFQNSQ